MERKIKHKQLISTVKNPPKALEVVDPEKWKIYSALAVIILVSIIVYLPVFHNSLLEWADNTYIKDNALVHSFNLKEIFSHYIGSNWHPVTILTLAVEYHFFGLNATGYHAVNLLLHLLNVILVFYAIWLLSDKVAVALVASLLFGIHPLHVESVAWAAELKDLLYTFFFLASYIFYLKYVRELQKKEAAAVAAAVTAPAPAPATQYKFYYIALLLFLLSLLSKAMAASLPLVLILTDYFKGRKIDKKTLLEKAPFFLLAVVIGVVAILAQKSAGSILQITTIPQRIVFAAYGFITYLFKLLFPLNLSAYYPYPVNNYKVYIPIEYYAYLIAFIGLVIYIIYSCRFSKKIIFGMGFFTLTVLLVLQLLPVGNTIMADRYSYIPSIGIFYLAGEGFIFLWSKKLKSRTFGIALLSVSTVLFSVKTYARCGIWKNDMTLWNDVIDQYNTAETAYYNRGILFFNEKRYGEAIIDFNRAIELKPDFAEAHYNRGTFFVSIKINDEAIREFNISIGLKPDYVDAYINRGIVFTNEKRNDEAIKDFNKAIELKAGNAEAYINRGFIFMNEKRNGEALNDFNKAIELKPGLSDAYINRGIVFVAEKRIAEAINDFNKAIELKPDNTDAYNNRGFIFMNEKRNDEALKDFNKAIELDPGNAALYNNKANLFFEIKLYEKAIGIYTKVIALKTDYAQAYYKRGLAEYYSGKKDAACLDLKKAAGLGYKPAADALAQICK